MEKVFWKLYYKRSAICFFVIMLLFLSCILRIAVIMNSGYEEVYLSHNRLKLTGDYLRGTIYDRNMYPITNSKKKVIAAVSPTPRAITAISSLLKGDELEAVLNQLKRGKPVLCTVPEEITSSGIYCTTVYENDISSAPASHIIGYTDYENRGISGIEKAYDNLLFSEKRVTFHYESSADGKILEGLEPEIENDSSITANGVITTLDLNFQAISENAADALEVGAVVVAESKTGKIRAMVSRPDFNPARVSDFFDMPDSPLLNRAVNSYNIGSVFKPCVAAAAIENGASDFSHLCTGSTLIVDRYFKCHRHDGHGIMNLLSGIANSCNTFFYNLSISLGATSIYNKAIALKLSEALSISSGISTAGGSLPSQKTLQNPAQLANFSIGQGELLSTPVNMLNLYNAIANDGKYHIPSIVEGTIEKGSTTDYNIGNPIRAMKAKTAQFLKEALKEVIATGTGRSAAPKLTSAAGKTATAQTGKFANGEEIYQGWFCGFFPFESPEYTIIVFSENTKRQQLSCGEIFAEIADEITKLKT